METRELRVSLFDDSPENHLRAMDQISMLCDGAAAAGPPIDDAEIHRFSSSLTFLREWRLFNYKPMDVKFDGVCGLNLPQFSSAAIPSKNEELCCDSESQEPSDFVMYTGGSVWGLDWCPRVSESPSDSSCKCEFIAVSAHPPGSCYHKLGTPLSGRGLIQIWCVLNITENVEDTPAVEKSKRGHKRSVVVTEKSNEVKRPRGRPRKNAIVEHVAESDGNERHIIQPISVLVPENSSHLPDIEGIVLKEKPNEVKRPRGRPRKNQVKDHVAESDGNERHIIQPISSSCVQEQYIDVQSCDNNGESVCNMTLESTMQRNSVGKGNKSGNTNLPLHNISLPYQKVKIHKGRPWKKPLKGHVSRSDGNQPLDTQVTENSANSLTTEGVPGCTQEDSVQESIADKQNCHEPEESICNMTRKSSVHTSNVGNDKNQLVHSQDQLLTEELCGSSVLDPGDSGNISNDGNLKVSLTSCSLPDNVALPRVVLCLAHNGKVAWDVKWRPSKALDSKCKYRMGFLAVLLGNGSLEVWEIPLPHTVKVLYSSSKGEGTDPRFVKLKPVFRCSMLKSGGAQSIPLSVEWSASTPHDFLLAGCHDGTVALWKFSASDSTKDTRPLLCFSADTAPIRAVSWAPVGSDSQSGNVIVTAGHEGLKFWDIRDPFRPLWDIHQAPRIIYGLDWVPDPRCLVLSFDDGTIKILSLIKAACDVPVTGKPFTAIKQLGLHSYNGSSYAIWSVQVSRPTGMVAYCGAEGTVVRYQLTTSAVDKEFSRNRAPHFLCGSLTADESSVTINTPVLNTPYPLKPANRSGETPLAFRDILSESYPSKGADKKKRQHSDSDDQNIALGCDIEPEPEESLASLKKQKPSKSISSSKKKPEDNLQLVAIDDEPKNGKEKEKDYKYEVLPSKDTALHRVRWNMNKGGERWLCYGGAAGIVRCQEIVLSEIDKKWAKKK